MHKLESFVQPGKILLVSGAKRDINVKKFYFNAFIMFYATVEIKGEQTFSTKLLEQCASAKYKMQDTYDSSKVRAI